MKIVEGLKDTEERKRNSNKYLIRVPERESKDCKEKQNMKV